MMSILYLSEPVTMLPYMTKGTLHMQLSLRILRCRDYPELFIEPNAIS